MPDFIFCSDPGKQKQFPDLYARYFDEALGGEAILFQGPWGAILTSGSLYDGFWPFEDEGHIVVVHGGPLINIPDRPEVTGRDRYSRLILDEIRQRAPVDWFHAIGGPFALLVVDKKAKQVRLVSDLMGLLPLFALEDGSDWIVSTKLTPISRLAPTRAALDPVAACEFVLHGSTAFPHCLFSGVRRILPGVEIMRDDESRSRERRYWSPAEENPFRDIREAADVLRDTLVENVARVVHGKKVGMFLSGGEDSRTIMAATPAPTDVQCFTLADEFNREASIAQKAAAIAGRPWFLGKRSPDHYIKDLDYGCRVIGSEVCLDKMHFLGMPAEFNLLGYDAVVGGTFSDFLLKGYAASTVDHKIRGFRIWPSREMDTNERGMYVTTEAYIHDMNSYLSGDFVAQIGQRKRDHFEFIRTVRPASAAEWWNIWPASQTSGSDQFLQTTRCFRSYEPFNMNNLVALGSAVPLSWKLNRRLFHRAFHGTLGRLGWQPHPDGWLPALGNWGNVTAGVAVGGSRLVRKVFSRKAPINDYSWPLWSTLVHRPLFHSIAEEYRPEFSALTGGFLHGADDLLLGDVLEGTQKLRLLQVLHTVRETRGG